MPVVIVDGKEIELGADERLNGIQVAARAGVEIPHYCWHPGLSVVASCRMCLVESGRRDETGKITMVPKLVPACQTPATDGTVFVTNSPNVIKARAMVEEDLLIDHPIDCPICDKAGECTLQDYYFEHGQGQRRADLQPFTSRKREMGDTVTLFVDRCVMCTRCVRFTREITGTAELMVINRGSHEEIDVFPGYPLANKMSGNVVDLCPVGALGDRDFLYQQRVWFMNSHDNVCGGCSSGCSIKVEENQDRVYRIKPRENPHVNQWWLCDEGRYGYHHVHADNRITQPTKREADGSIAQIDWIGVIKQVDERFRAAGRVAVVLSPFLTVEEAYLLAKYAKSVDPQALVAVGKVPVVGENEVFKNGFTIHAEKAPNRKGVEAIAARFNGGLLGWKDLPAALEKHNIKAVWISGGYKSDWVDAETAEKIAAAVPLVVVQDLFASPLMDVATYQLPAASFAERAGSYVNFADRLQSFDWAIRPPVGVQPEGFVYSRLLGIKGLWKSRPILEELAREMAYFSAAMHGVPPLGIDLKVNLLAAEPAGASA